MKRIYPAGKIQDATIDKTFRNINAGLDWESRLRNLKFAPFPVFEDFMLIMRTGPDIRIEQIYGASMVWMEVADAVFVHPDSDWKSSHGCKLEIERARELGIRVFYDIESLCTWARGGEDE